MITVPAQLVGGIIGFLPTLLLGRNALHVPWLPGLVLVGMAVAAGLAAGWLAQPPSDRQRPAIALAGGFGLLGFAFFSLLVQLRAPMGSAPSAFTVLLGGLVVALLQTVVVAVVWRRRHQL